MKKKCFSPPGMIDGNTSESEIANHFANIYSDLYNSVNDNEIHEIKEKADQAVTTICGRGGCCDSSHVITPNIVKRAIAKQKKGKKDEIHNLSSDNLIEAPNSLASPISQIFIAILRHSCTDELFNSCLMKPNPKNMLKSLSDSSNYRAITLNTVLSKLFDYILIIILDDQLQSSYYQFAYKSNFSTSLCTFLVVETIQYYRSRGSNVYALLLDASKAFDRVKYSKLFEVMLERKICPLIVRLLINIYSLNCAKVKWNNTLSDEFPLNNGVKQGGVISPLLFSLYLDPLLRHLEDSGKGCFMGNLCANAFAYADDIIILAPTCSSLRSLIKICEEYSNEYCLIFNPSKCSLMFFSDPNFDTSLINIRLCNEQLKIVN